MSSSDEHKNLLHRAPSGSSTARSPALPWEVIERTIDHCSGDATMLCAFALTCSQLHPRSLFVLFKSVHLRSATQLMGFYDAVRAQPHLQPVVQSLSFPWDDFYPFPLLSILPNLRHLTFNWILSVIWDDIQLSQSCGMQSVAGLQTLTIRSARFGTRSAFLHFLSIFPNIESLTCEYVIIQSRTPLVEELDLSRPLLLRTLNILQHVNADIAALLVHMTQIAATNATMNGERTVSSSMPPPQSGENRRASLTWWIQVEDVQINRAIQALRGSPEQTAIRDITLVLWHRDVVHLYREYRRPANLELCARLDQVLLGYPCHRLLLTIPGGLVLNVRKTISWPDEFSRCFRPLSGKRALVEDVRYSGKPGHDSAVSALVVSPDGRWVATASKDSTVILWDARDACISQEWFAHDGKVWDLAFSQDSRHLASAGKDEKVAIWDISGTSHQVVALEGHSSIVEGCAWSSDGAYIASRDSDNIVRVWDGRTFQPLPVDSEMAHIKPLFSPDSHRLLVPHGGSCGVLDFVSDACLALDMPTRGEDVYPISAAFSRLGTHIAVGYDNGVVRVWDAANRQQCLLLRAHEDPVTDVVFSPDGRLLLSASDDRTMKVWDAHTGAMVRSLDGHEIGVRGACFSPCGTYIASAAETVRIWRTSDGSCLAVLSDHDDPWVSHVAFTPDGTMLWSGAFNGTVLGRRLQDVIPDEFKV